MALIIQKLSVVATPIRIAGLPSSVGQVVLPLPLVLVPVLIEVLPVPVCSSVFEVAIVPAAVGHHKAPPPLALAPLELALHVVAVVKAQYPCALGPARVHFSLVVPLQLLQVHLLRLVYVKAVQYGRQGGHLLKARPHCLAHIRIIHSSC